MTSINRLFAVSSASLFLLVACGSDGDGGTSTRPQPEAGTAGSGGRGSGGAASKGGSSGAQTGGGGQGTGGSAAGDGGADGSGGAGTGDSGDGGASGGSPSDAGSGGGDAGPIVGDAGNGAGCEKDNECASGHCVGGICCGVACDSPGECEALPAQCVNTASGNECSYAAKPNGTACDDGDGCTIGEKCQSARCGLGAGAGTPKDCSDYIDAARTMPNLCTVDKCVPGGECNHSEAVNCDDGNACTTDSCVPATGCRNANNTLACDDGNACTTGDRCANAQCSGTPKNCDTLNADCAVGVCNQTSGQCQAQARNNGQACDDALGACDTTGRCAAGACVGQDDACGPLATACQECTSGAQCFQGRDCTCPAGGSVIEVSGSCVLNTDECRAGGGNNCAANATCNDPSSASGNYTCTCPPGFAGNGRTGAGGTGCTCGAGSKVINTPSGPECVCDLDGTFVLMTTTNITLPAVSGFVEPSPPGGVPSYNWSLRKHTTAQDGTLTVQTIPCGGTAPVLCNIIDAFDVAHAQFTPVESLGQPGMVCPDARRCTNGVTTQTGIRLSGVRPGGGYAEPETVTLSGIILDNPAGAWPACRQCVLDANGNPVGASGGTNCTCGASTANNPRWLDSDGDQGAPFNGMLGVTTLAVPRGGALIGDGPRTPAVNYAEPSVCPRLSANGAVGTYNYQAVPGFALPLSSFNVNEISAAGRSISSLTASGPTAVQMTGGSCQITGTLTGSTQYPDGPHVDARVFGCKTCTLNPQTRVCTPTGAACTGAQVDFFDDVTQNQTIVSSSFTLKKSTLNMDDILSKTGAERSTAIINACAQVRAQNCPAGETCVDLTP